MIICKIHNFNAYILSHFTDYSGTVVYNIHQLNKTQMQIRNQAIDTFNTDLKLIRSLSMSAPRPQLPHPTSLQQLATLLKYKNAPLTHSQAQIQQGREWLSKKGVDLNPLLSRLSRAQESQLSQKQISPPQDNYFYIDLNEKNIEEYLEKAKEHAFLNLAQSVMSKGSNRQKFIKRVLQDLQEQGQSRFKVTWEKERCIEKRDQYLKIVKTVVSKEKDYGQTLKELIPAFKNSFKQFQQPIWDILHFQLQVYKQELDQNKNMSKLFIQSLKLVQRQFEQRLLGQNIEKYINTHYLSKTQGKYQIQKGNLWARAWLYMSAGLKQKFVQLLSPNPMHSDIIKAYIQTQESIKKGVPVRIMINPRSDIRDVFYQQILFCLSGQSKYSCEIMAQMNSLQLVWVLLRTTAIFWPETKDRFVKIRSSLVQSYSDCSSQPQLIRQMAYLLDYEAIINLGPNAAMNRDDYLHLLLAFSAYPQLFKNSILEQKLTNKLAQYILQLFMQKKPEYLLYVALIPPRHLASQISEMIVASDAIDSFNWKGLKDIINDEIYVELVKETFDRYVGLQGNHLKAAQKLYELVGANEKALDYLAQMLVRHYLQRQSQSIQDVTKAEQLGIRLSRQRGVNHIYDKLFIFFRSFGQLQSLLPQRDQYKLQQFLSNSQFILLDGRAGQSVIPLLQKLIKLKGVQVYFSFVAAAVKGAQIVMFNRERYEQLSNFKRVLLSVCTSLLNSKTLQQYKNSPIIERIIRYLQ